MGQMRKFIRGVARARGGLAGVRATSKRRARVRTALHDLQKTLAARRTLAAIRKAAHAVDLTPHPAGGSTSAAGKSKGFVAKAKTFLRKVVGSDA
jgi:hypothetical protein